MNDSLPPPSRLLRAYCAATKFLLWLLIALWLALALGWGALHAFIVPRIGELRPWLEIQATRALGAPVRIGAIEARGGNLVPSFELREVVLADGQGRDGLRLPRVLVTLSPRSLWNRGFEQLYVEGPELDVRRGTDGTLRIAGLDVSQSSGQDSPAADWFFRQKRIVIRGGVLRWTDEMRGAPTLALREVDLAVRNSGRRHGLRVDATPPAAWGDRFTVRGQFRHRLFSPHPGRWREWEGQVFADFSAVDLSQLRRHADLGVEVGSGRGAMRAWADVVRGEVVGGAADVALQDVDARLAADRPALALAAVSGRLAGRRLPGGFEVETRDLQFTTGDGVRWPGGNVALAWTAARGRELAQGRLRGDRLDLAALGRLASHLPLGTDTLAALQAHAPRGLVEQVQARWQGDPDRLRSYEARGRVTGLGVASRAGPDGAQWPGLQGATVEFEASQAGGRANLVIEDGAVELAGVFDEARVPLDQLAADLRWRLDGDRIALDVEGLRFRNPDAQGEGRLAWHTGATPARRFPGVLDLQASITRADGARVWRYLPTGVPALTRDYVRQAVLSGQATDGQVRVRGDLHDFPFTQPGSGEFRISAQVRNATYAFAPRELVPGPAQWPALTQLSGELVFERNTMRVNGAQGRFVGAPSLQVRAQAQIPDLDSTTVLVSGDIRGPLAESLAVINASPVGESIGNALARATASGDADVRLELELPVADMARSRVQGSVTLAGNDVQLTPDSPALTQARGVVAFTDTGFDVQRLQARALGGALTVEGGTRRPPAAPGEASALLRIQGTASAEGLQRERALGLVAGLASRATGEANYVATIALRGDTPEIRLTSTLEGLALNLPAPLNKPADAVLPLRLENTVVQDAPQAQDQWLVELGRVASVAYVRDTRSVQPRVVRGAIGIGLAEGESSPLPADGVRANINLDTADLDAWRAVFAGLDAPAEVQTDPLPGQPAERKAAAADLQSYLPTVLAVRARELTASGRTLHNLVVGGSREGLTWRANVDATELNGYVEYRQPSEDAEGRVFARLARLSIAEAAASQVESLLAEQPATIPGLDVAVDDFELRGKRLGRLEIAATNRGPRDGTATQWRLDKLHLTVPEGTLAATGYWAPVGAQDALRLSTGPERRRTVMNFRLDVADAGQLLARLGMEDVVRRGRGRLEGQVGWLGSPLSLDYASMNGNFAVNVEAGQFLKVDPGLGKLLSVLSLQSLPRRLTLDFRDVFSEGFAFDFVRGDIGIEQGIAQTNNLQMKGVNAAVLMEGQADIARETQALKVVVVPEINAGTASLVATVINPAIGLGTFLAQMFLREPLMRAATQEFQVDGTWADPRIVRVPRRSAAPAATQADALPPGQIQGNN